MKTYEELREMWSELFKNKEQTPGFRHLRENHIFDENKSVKWNKEKVIEYNANLDQKRKEYYENIANKKEVFEKELDEYLIKEIGKNKISKEQLEKIKQLIYNYSEEDYRWNNGFDNTMIAYNDFIKLLL